MSKLADSMVAFIESTSPSLPLQNLELDLLGAKCTRKLWYAFMQVLDTPRLAADVNSEALDRQCVDNIERMLKAMDVAVWNRDPHTGELWHLECPTNKYIQGTIQGVLKAPNDEFGIEADVPHVYMVLRLTDHQIDLFAEHGFVKWSHRRAVQLNTQMALTESIGNFVNRGVVIGVSESGRIHTEVVPYSSELYESTLIRGDLIISTEAAPERHSSCADGCDPNCMFADVCSGEVVSRPRLRNCAFAERDKKTGRDYRVIDGKRTEKEVDHIFNPALIQEWAGQPLSYSRELGMVEYENFFNGNTRAKKMAHKLGKPVYTSKELHLIFSNAIEDEVASEHMNEFIKRFNATMQEERKIPEIPNEDDDVINEW